MCSSCPTAARSWAGSWPAPPGATCPTHPPTGGPRRYGRPTTTRGSAAAVVNQQVARLTLQRRGFEVVVAADGAEAVEALGDGTDYDLVLMDCQMPRMDGFAATAEIRRRQAGGPSTPIIAMTASSTTEDRARCLAAGMDDFVAKPVRPDDLEAVLRRWLR
jgi:CheY-like chemotaxis protein